MVVCSQIVVAVAERGGGGSASGDGERGGKEVTPSVNGFAANRKTETEAHPPFPYTLGEVFHEKRRAF